MRHFRFSLSSLLWFVLVLGIAFAALASPLGWWKTAFKATILGSLFFSILAAIHGQRTRRAFWLGFAVVGWGYFALQQLPRAVELPTTAVSWKISEYLQPEKVVSGNVTNNGENYARTEVIQWLWPGLVGLLGGGVAYLLDMKPKSGTNQDANDNET